MCDGYLIHYGIKRRSGRYPWGSGKRPYQSLKGVKGQYQIEEYTTPEREMRKAVSKAMVNQLIAAVVPGYAAFHNARVIAYKASQNLGSGDYEKAEGRPKKVKDLRRQTQKTSLEEDLKIINKSGVFKRGHDKNCMNCVIATEMRRRGYDVVARRADNGLVNDYVKTFKNCELKKFDVRVPTQDEILKDRKSAYNNTYNQAMNQLENFGDGARGSLVFAYDKKLGQSAGHTMYWEVQNGRAKIYDPQNNSNKVVNECLSLSDLSSWTYARLDNLKLTDDAGIHVTDEYKKK